jgi:hypothetical protein
MIVGFVRIISGLAQPGSLDDDTVAEYNVTHVAS